MSKASETKYRVILGLYRVILGLYTVIPVDKGLYRVLKSSIGFFRGVCIYIYIAPIGEP